MQTHFTTHYDNIITFLPFKKINGLDFKGILIFLNDHLVIKGLTMSICVFYNFKYSKIIQLPFKLKFLKVANKAIFIFYKHDKMTTFPLK